MLNLKNWTLKNQITLMIGSLGSISLIFSILIINLYSQQIIDNHKQASEDLIRHQVSMLRDKSLHLLEEFGISLQQNPRFNTAFQQQDAAALGELLDERFSFGDKTARVLGVNKVFIYDTEYRLIAQSSKGEDYGIQGSICPDTLQNTRNSTNKLTGKVIDALCYQAGHAFNTTFLPIGSIQPQGYIYILSNPLDYLIKVEENLRMPLRIDDRSDKRLYASADWSSALKQDTLLLKHVIYDNTNTRLFTLSTLQNISRLTEQSNTIQNLIIIAVLLVTAIAVLISLFTFNSLMVNPLRTLTQHLSLIDSDKSQMKNALTPTGSQEIRQLISRFNTMHDKLADLYNSLEHIAFTDQLTALPNRSKLQDILTFQTELNRKNNTPFALFMMDLDRFKSVNDALGHHAGDYLLQQVSSRLAKVVRKSDYITPVTKQDVSIYHMDVVARLGGDEFAVVLPEIANIEDAKTIAEKILQTMKAPFIVEGNTFSIGMSIGISACPAHGREPELLMQHADIAMYHAKKNRLGYAIYDINFEQDRIDTLTMEDDLREALRTDSLSLVYQPKIDLHNNTVVGVETLLRWTHDIHGFIPPDKFIPIAEQSTLINEVSRWVIQKTLQQKREWENNNIFLSVAINISAKNLLCDAFLNFIGSQVNELQLDAASIILELTETAVMADPGNSITTLKELKKMGFQLSIDDFGTGYSSLSYLKQLPVDEIKIDRSFVMDMEQDENDAIIVQSTIDLAHNMGLRVTAEGVENANILGRLKERKTDYAQGYYMCQPISSADLEKWLIESQWGNKCA